VGRPPAAVLGARPGRPRHRRPGPVGGYNTALLACLEPDLACAIPGIPATSFERLLFEHASHARVRELESRGVTREMLAEVFRPVSPLVLEPQVAPAGRAIFGGTADRLVPPDQVRDLFAHWGEPPIAWYHGGHITFQRERSVKDLIETTLRETGLVGAA